ncbi:acyl-CoA dehydrogenase [Paenarthrobacter sp. Z7-10]|uniref:acyl-CoA dehydrogenase n=1 Tax=Paenarthrobacter sp. Z7-10 TaxID=2787635 RepID=UPI0022A93FCD|nr:acyl-CoA dehydrogenase [Paenarthrobacter sp. Z7-10]MCZ2404370.1 acyl-CoA dehydrogenase [Paenarthrobacter sp. Z7-10]
MPVRLVPGPNQLQDSGDDLPALWDQTRACAGEIRPALDLAIQLGRKLPFPMNGQTRRLWEALATVSAADVSLARILEPHLDALAIIGQAPDLTVDDIPGGSDGCWGVFAAEAPGSRLQATWEGKRDGKGAGDGKGNGEAGWILSGTKPWCSLGAELSHAVVTAQTDDGRRAFAVRLRQPGVQPDDVGWSALGLAKIRSGPINFDRVPAVPVGGPGWYFSRPGFSWGGAGVAAVWFGAAVAIARRVFLHCSSREADQIARMHLGLIDAEICSARNALLMAAGHADGPDGGTGHRLAAARARAAVVGCAEAILEIAGHAMGPAPLAFEPDYAARTADLALYLRQDHAERSSAAIGEQLLAGGAAPW